MKKHCILIVFFLALLVGVLSACTTDMHPIPGIDVSSSTSPQIDTAPFESTPSPALTSPSSVMFQAWQSAYEDFLKASKSQYFYLCDIDGNEIPELLISLFSEFSDTNKYAEYDVYTYDNGTIECIGDFSTLTSSSFWLDNNGGILGYAYGAGAGGTYRAHIDNGILCYDGEIYGYYFDKDANYIEWFINSNGSEIIVTEETKDEYERILKNKIELERYDITERNILNAIYNGIYTIPNT